MIDIDGTVSDDIPNEESHRFINASLIDGAVEKVNKLYSESYNYFFYIKERRS